MTDAKRPVVRLGGGSWLTSCPEIAKKGRLGRPTAVAWTGGRLLMDKAGIAIKFQRSWMDRNDRCAGHHILDLQGQQRTVRVLLYAAGALTLSIARRRWIWII